MLHSRCAAGKWDHPEYAFNPISAFASRCLLTCKQPNSSSHLLEKLEKKLRVQNQSTVFKVTYTHRPAINNERVRAVSDKDGRSRCAPMTRVANACSDCREKNSCVASCCMCCLRGSNAFVTTGCWLQVAKGPNSTRRGWPCRCRCPMRRRCSPPKGSWRAWPRRTWICARAARSDVCKSPPCYRGKPACLRHPVLYCRQGGVRHRELAKAHGLAWQRKRLGAALRATLDTNRTGSAIRLHNAMVQNHMPVRCNAD